MEKYDAEVENGSWHQQNENEDGEVQEVDVQITHRKSSELPNRNLDFSTTDESAEDEESDIPIEDSIPELTDEQMEEPVEADPPNSELETQTNEPSESGSGGFVVFTILVIFVLSVSTLVFVYTNFPELEESEKGHIKFPTTIDDAKILGDILYRYKDKYFYEVFSAICVSYIFLQTFAIPGSIFLSILSGFLFSFPVALLLICFCSATGASFCYLISYLIGRKVVYRCFPERAQAWAATVKKHKHNLLNYIIFLRITPLIPNWFINITAPVLDVPLLPFWLGTFIGVGPPSIVAIQAGTTLHELASANDAVSWTSLIILLIVGLLSLIPVLLKDVLKSQFD